MQTVRTILRWCVIALVLVGAISMSSVVNAQSFTEDIGSQLSHTAGPNGADYGYPTDPRVVVVVIIRILLALVGTVLFVYIFYAGFLWMTAAGNTEQVEKAQAIIRNGVIGLIIIFASYTITVAAANLARGLPVGWGTGWAGFINSFY